MAELLAASQQPTQPAVHRQAATRAIPYPTPTTPHTHPDAVLLPASCHVVAGP